MVLLLFPQGEVHGSGLGRPIDLGDHRGEAVCLTLSIDRISVGERLDVAVWGSSDGDTWGTRPLAVLPHKYYCGAYRYHLDLTMQPSIRYLRVQYQMSEGLPGTGRHGHPVALMSIGAELEQMALAAHA